MAGQGSPGVCTSCGQLIEALAPFVNIGPTDWNDPTKPRTQRWIAPATDIHGWTPFEIFHPSCFVKEHGAEALDRLIGDAP